MIKINFCIVANGWIQPINLIKDNERMEKPCRGDCGLRCLYQSFGVWRTAEMWRRPSYSWNPTAFGHAIQGCSARISPATTYSYAEFSPLALLYDSSVYWTATSNRPIWLISSFRLYIPIGASSAIMTPRVVGLWSFPWDAISRSYYSSRAWTWATTPRYNFRAIKLVNRLWKCKLHPDCTISLT